MALVDTNKMFKMAYNNGFAVGAFNVYNMEITEAIVAAAAEERAPLILQILPITRKYSNMTYLRSFIDALIALNPDIPIALNLDHGDSIETCKKCVDEGFTSVMIDASHLPFAENVAATKQVVDYAHPRGVVVEAELGKIGGIEENVPGVTRDDIKNNLTDPDQVVEFVGNEQFAWVLGAATLEDDGLTEGILTALAGAPALSAAGFSAQADACLAHDTRERASRIGAPALVLAGEDDVLLPATAAEALAGLLPRGRFERHPGGHAFLSESTAAVAASVLRFLDSARESTKG